MVWVSENGRLTPTPVRIGAADATQTELVNPTLGEGATLHAEAIVRWVRAKTSDLPAGLGVAFTRLSDGDRRTITDFCAHRPALFHD